MFEYKSFNYKIKAVDEAENIVEGYGAFFDNMDSYRDIIKKGSFLKTIAENRERMKFLWQHDMAEPIGKFLEMFEDENGLYIKAKISNTDVGSKAMQLIRDGVLDEMSIGYETIKDEYDRQNNVRYIKEVKLYEVSIVTIAANSLAKVTAYKNENAKLDSRLAFVVNEIKEGRVISKSNMKKLNEVLKLLESIVGTIDEEPKSFEPSKITQNDEDISSEDYQKLLDQLRSQNLK